MWSLLRAELTRLRWRRAVLVLLVAAVAVPAVLLAAEAWNTRPITDSDRREAQAQIDEMIASSGPMVEECLEHPRQWGLPKGATEEECASNVIGSVTVEDWIYRPPLEVSTVLEGTGLGVVFVLAMLAALVGTTFVGHDWASGSMSNQLLFEPRRIRVWAAKAIAVVLATAVTALLVLVAWWLGIVAVAGARDIAASAEVWSDVRSMVLRGVLVVAMAALVAYALTALFRSTVAALGLMFGTAVVGNLLVAAVIGPGAERWMLPTNVLAFVRNGYEYYVGDGGYVECDEMGNCTGMETLSLTHAAVYLGTIVVVSVALSLWSFRRRDVP